LIFFLIVIHWLPGESPVVERRIIMALLRECLNEVRLRSGEAGVLDMPANGARDGWREARVAGPRLPGRTGAAATDRLPANAPLLAPRPH
jgi:hypothetical protein